MYRSVMNFERASRTANRSLPTLGMVISPGKRAPAALVEIGQRAQFLPFLRRELRGVAAHDGRCDLATSTIIEHGLPNLSAALQRLFEIAAVIAAARLQQHHLPVRGIGVAHPG